MSSRIGSVSGAAQAVVCSECANAPMLPRRNPCPSPPPPPPFHSPCRQVRCSASQRGELSDLANIFRGSVLDVSPSCMTIEVVGKEDKMKAFTDLLEPYGEAAGEGLEAREGLDAGTGLDAGMWLDAGMGRRSVHLRPVTSEVTTPAMGLMGASASPPAPCPLYHSHAPHTGILEIARTGRVAMPRDSGVNSEFLERMSMGRVW